MTNDGACLYVVREILPEQLLAAVKLLHCLEIYCSHDSTVPGRAKLPLRPLYNTYTNNNKY